MDRKIEKFARFEVIKPKKYRVFVLVNKIGRERFLQSRSDLRELRNHINLVLGEIGR